jgi:aspartyl/glutamyl-tRNA(Asn/Gln) amidotransferase C subunit
VINQEEIKKLSSLVRLDLTSEEIKKMGQDEAKILDYVDQLKSLDIDKVSLLNDRFTANLRADEPSIFNLNESLINSFSLKQGRFLKAPLVFEDNG